MSKFGKFKIIYNIITDVWNSISKYKNTDFTESNEDEICMDMVNEVQKVRNKYSDKRSGKLVSEIATAILDYIFFKEEKND